MRTTADECKYELKERIKEALQEANKFLYPDTWGYEEYDNSYRENIREIRHNLEKAYDLL